MFLWCIHRVIINILPQAILTSHAISYVNQVSLFLKSLYTLASMWGRLKLYGLRTLDHLGRYLPFLDLFLHLWSCDDSKIHFVDTQKALKCTKCLLPWFVSFRFLCWKLNPPFVCYRCLEIETLRVNGSCRLCPHEWTNLLVDSRVNYFGSLIYLANGIWRWLALGVIFLWYIIK